MERRKGEGLMKPLPQLATTAPLPAAVPPCLDRRAFLGNSALLAVGTLLASACGDGSTGSSVTGANLGTTTVKIADYTALATVGGIAKLNGTTTPVAVVRTATATYRAFSLVCPHEGTVVVANNGAFVCPNHQARFSNVGIWQGGQQTSNLREYAVVFDATAGTLTIS